MKMFTNRHGNDIHKIKYDFTRDSKLPTGKMYDDLLRGGNRANLAAAIVKCWSEQTLVECLPDNKSLVVGGPDKNAITLKKNSPASYLIELESNQVEADTRMMLHINQMMGNNDYDSIVVKSIDTDVVFLCIYYASLIKISMLFVDYSLPQTDKQRYINCTTIQKELIEKYRILPQILLNVYTLSGCDTCSFVRNISKTTFLQTLFNNNGQYNDLDRLKALPTTKDDIKTVEKLIIDCLHNRRRSSQALSSSSQVIQQQILSVDTLRAIMAMNALKQKKKAIAPTLPPTSDALLYHCLRVSRQIQIWKNAMDNYINYPELTDCGFETVNDRLEIKWTSKLPFPNDPGLKTCGKCKGNCHKCNCGQNYQPCTIYCQCSAQVCENRAHAMKQPKNCATTMFTETSVINSLLSDDDDGGVDYSFNSGDEGDKNEDRIEDEDALSYFDLDESGPNYSRTTLLEPTFKQPSIPSTFRSSSKRVKFSFNESGETTDNSSKVTRSYLSASTSQPIRRYSNYNVLDDLTNNWNEDQD
ncbi:unnamed protein product, partial [Didymodactylos carnosus]